MNSETNNAQKKEVVENSVKKKPGSVVPNVLGAFITKSKPETIKNEKESDESDVTESSVVTKEVTVAKAVKKALDNQFDALSRKKYAKSSLMDKNGIKTNAKIGAAVEKINCSSADHLFLKKLALKIQEDFGRKIAISDIVSTLIFYLREKKKGSEAEFILGEYSTLQVKRNQELASGFE